MIKLFRLCGATTATFFVLTLFTQEPLMFCFFAYSLIVTLATLFVGGTITDERDSNNNKG